MLFVPLPSHVYCPLEVQARGAESVYVVDDGILDEVLVRPGDQVTEGQCWRSFTISTSTSRSPS